MSGQQSKIVVIMTGAISIETENAHGFKTKIAIPLPAISVSANMEWEQLHAANQNNQAIEIMREIAAVVLQPERTPKPVIETIAHGFSIYEQEVIKNADRPSERNIQTQFETDDPQGEKRPLAKGGGFTTF